MLCRYILNMQIRKGRTLETAKDPLPGHRRAEEGAGETGWQRTNPRGAGGQGPCANMAPSWPLPRPGSHLSAQLAGCLSLPPPEQCGPTGAPRNHVSKQVSTLSQAFSHLIWISGCTFKVGLILQEKPQFRELRAPGQAFRCLSNQQRSNSKCQRGSDGHLADPVPSPWRAPSRLILSPV